MKPAILALFLLCACGSNQEAEYPDYEDTSASDYEMPSDPEAEALGSPHYSSDGDQDDNRDESDEGDDKKPEDSDKASEDPSQGCEWFGDCDKYTDP